MNDDQIATLKREAEILAGAMWRLEQHGYIHARDDEDEEQCNHWREIARDAVERIRSIVMGAHGG